MIGRMSVKQAPSLARGAAAPRVLLVKPTLPSRNVVVKFREDEKDVFQKGKEKLADAKDKASEQLSGLNKSAQSGATGEYTQDKARQGEQNPLRAGTSFDSQVQTNWAVSAFTRRREVFAGRLAMVGFTAACFWEWYFPSHPNILQQVSAFTAKTGFELSEATVLSLVVALVAWNAISALTPASPTNSRENQEDVAKRNAGPTQEVPGSFQQAVGIRGYGFSKANELFVGRMAMIGFAAAIIGQLQMGGLDGPGPIAQVARYLGQVPDASFYGGAANIFILSAIATVGIAFLRGQFGTAKGEEDIY